MRSPIPIVLGSCLLILLTDARSKLYAQDSGTTGTGTWMSPIFHWSMPAEAQIDKLVVKKGAESKLSYRLAFFETNGELNAQWTDFELFETGGEDLTKSSNLEKLAERFASQMPASYPIMRISKTGEFLRAVSLTNAI